MFSSRAQAPPAPGRRGTWVGCGCDVGWGGGSLGRAAHRTQRGWGLEGSPTPTLWTFGAGVGWVDGGRTQVKKEIVVAKLLGCWRRRGSAHLDNQLCVGNRSRLWESELGSTSHLSHADPGPGQEALEMGPLPAPAPSHQLPHSARPRPVSGSSFLPLPLCREPQVWGGDYHSPLRALDQYRNLGAAGAGSCPPPPPARSAALARGAFAPAVPAPCSRPCRLAPAPGLATRFRRLEFRKVARPHIQRLLAEVRGRQGAARGPVLPGGLGVDSRPRD